MDYGFEFIINNGGVDTEEDYPYKARDGQCDPNRVRVKLKQNSIFLWLWKIFSLPWLILFCIFFISKLCIFSPEKRSRCDH